MQTAFDNLVKLKEWLGYSLTVFVLIESTVTYAHMCPESIARTPGVLLLHEERPSRNQSGRSLSSENEIARRQERVAARACAGRVLRLRMLTAKYLRKRKASRNRFPRSNESRRLD